MGRNRCRRRERPVCCPRCCCCMWRMPYAMDPYDCASRFRDPYDPFDYAPGLGGPEELPSFAGPGRDIVYDAPINCYQIYEDLRGACARGEVDGRCAELDDWLRACLASTSFRRMAGGF